MRELEGKAAAEGVPDDMRPLHAQMAQQRPAVSRLPRHTDGAGGAAATRVATAVVGDEPVPTGQTGLGRQRPERVRDDAPWMSATGSPVPETRLAGP